ncbi:1-deoxy-D-xylulose 5-phosphate reductoisomerase [Rubripirellula lacrimiformis]|uniref:1-deoxy-D-xylulose 5-phosphate reductoisomerase n=1 Tax=Rubripirellula lacrimiformis TaxID=1930273 RepID=A0A517NL75_9BACT|nr:1-deoxy-D-xylulose-5-phosphate reductoisomerase [Rubripirellula lacrimiformis]QDT07892.1 1-deoxy-D-xylulose 5-phosphate reductoisomerase [Rubripirellula lacrimiformis]
MSNSAASNAAASNSAAPIQKVAVLGATGSIGTATAEVINHLNRVDSQYRWHLWAASGHQNLDRLIEIADAADDPPEHLVMSDPASAANFTSMDAVAGGAAPRPNSSSWPDSLAGTRISYGPDALIDVASAPEVDVVVASIVGRAGLESTLAAVQAGKRVALANKETLVVAGPLVRQAMLTSGAELLPVDSEHSAIFQCMGGAASACAPGHPSGHPSGPNADPHPAPRPKKLILTASGGPFRTWTKQQMSDATVESALAHPTWDMGPKITIDSATMMNKSLEIIEARWLFDLPAEAIEVVVHPQSIIHSMVEFDDGSVIAQLSPPDMKLPIQYALTYPRRLACPSPPLDRTRSWDLTLEVADQDRFPGLTLGFEVAAAGGTAGAVVNAANEEAVGLFLNGQIRFTDIVLGCRDVLEHHTHESAPTLSRLLELDRWARAETRQRFKL